MVDDFSRFIWMKAIPSKTKEEAVKNMLDVFTTFGFPRDFKTDNGGEFENELAFDRESSGSFTQICATIKSPCQWSSGDPKSYCA